MIRLAALLDRHILGSVFLAFAGGAERAIEWGERGMRLSPFDPWAFSAYRALTLAHFHRGRYEAAGDAAHRSVIVRRRLPPL
jgi:hypothetical protein